MPDIREGMELQAREFGFPLCATVSQAISLRRIADALEFMMTAVLKQQRDAVPTHKRVK